MLRYRLDARGESDLCAVDLPTRVVIVAYDSGASSRTSELRKLVDRARYRVEVRHALARLCELAVEASAALQQSEADAFVDAACAFCDALAALGRACSAPIVPPSFSELARLARRERAAFLPSGAGGGDIGLWIGTTSPSAAFAARAEALSMRPLSLEIDRGGLRLQSFQEHLPAPPSDAANLRALS